MVIIKVKMLVKSTLTIHDACKSKNMDLKKGCIYNSSVPTEDDTQLGNIVTHNVGYTWLMLQFQIWHRANVTDTSPRLDPAKFKGFGLG